MPPTAFWMALDASESPMSATVGPMTAAGMILSIHFTPANLTAMAMTTYTSPANTAPMISPNAPSDMETPPANAAHIELMKANELPRNTGLRNLVNSWYTSVPAPAPNKAAEIDISLPVVLLTTIGTVMVAARMASSCCNANSTSCPGRGLSFTP